jgi:hypothetical protein
MLSLIGQLRFYLFLHSPQKKRTQDLVEAIDNQQLFFFSEAH